MIKVQDLANIHMWKLSNPAKKIISWMIAEFKIENSVPKDKIKEFINRSVDNNCFNLYRSEVYDYLCSYCSGDFSEAIEVGNKNAVEIAKYYLKKELFNKLDEMEDK